MDLGFASRIGDYYLQALAGKSAAVKNTADENTTAKNGGVSFGDIVSTKSAQRVSERENVNLANFKNQLQSMFPGAYYHVMDASKIPQGTWQRTDFPFEKFFAEEIDESVLNWTPGGPAPAMTDPKVQSRLDSVLGQHSIVVPPELEEKIKNNPALADKVMANINNLLAWNGYPVPGRINSALIVLDENGEVARWNLISGGGGITGPTEAEQRQFEEEQKAKKIRRARYAQINEEYALKRKLQEMERNKAYYQESIKALPISSVHQRRIREAINSVSHSSIGVSKANQALEWRHNGN